MKEIVKYSGIQFDPDLVEGLVEAHRQGLIPDTLPESTPTLHELIDRIR